MNNLYKTKYLKYKTKYVNLKIQHNYLDNAKKLLCQSDCPLDHIHYYICPSLIDKLKESHEYIKINELFAEQFKIHIKLNEFIAHNQIAVNIMTHASTINDQLNEIVQKYEHIKNMCDNTNFGPFYNRMDSIKRWI